MYNNYEKEEDENEDVDKTWGGVKTREKNNYKA